MQVNGREYNMDELMKTIDLESHQMQKIGSFYLTNQEIEILDRNFIDYRLCNSLKDLIMKVQTILDEEDIDRDDADELEYVLEMISERDYYQNTRK